MYTIEKGDAEAKKNAIVEREAKADAEHKASIAAAIEADRKYREEHGEDD